MLELSDALRSALNLSRVPDHSILWWFARHKKLEPVLLQEALEETVRRFKHGLRRPAEENDTGDPPRRHDEDHPKSIRLGWWPWTLLGYFYTTARATSAGERSGTEDSEAGLNGHWRCGWNLRCSWRSTCGWVLPGTLATLGLAESANTLLPCEQLLADAGYDCEVNHRFCREVLGVESLRRAKARRSKTVVAKAPYRKEIRRVHGDPGDSVLPNNTGNARRRRQRCR